jgi:hypothetical protein
VGWPLRRPGEVHVTVTRRKRTKGPVEGLAINLFARVGWSHWIGRLILMDGGMHKATRLEHTASGYGGISADKQRPCACAVQRSCKEQP